MLPMSLLRVEKVGKLTTASDALPGLRPHHLLLHPSDLLTHHLQAGQVVWLRRQPPHPQPASPPFSPSPPSTADASLVQVWSHASVAAGSARLQLSQPSTPSSTPSPSDLATVQVGDVVEVQSLTGPLLAATSVTLRQTPASGGAARTSSFIQPSIDAFITQSLVNTFCYIGMTITVDLFNAHHQLLVHDIQSQSSPSPSSSVPRSIISISPNPSTHPTNGVVPSTPPPLPIDSDLPSVYIVTSSTQVSIASASSTSATPSPDASSSVDFSSIGGLSAELQSVREMVELPLLSPDLFLSFGVRPPRGVLLYGQPGTGKTLIARAIAHQTFARFFSINGAEVTSKFVGESEQRLRSIFIQAQQQSPAIIFIDEIDALCPSREGVTDALPKRLVSTLLTLMDGMYGGGRVVVIGATNRPDALDAALRRPGRFDREVEIGVPSEEGRLEILTVMMKGVESRVTEEELGEVAKVTHGFVGADLKALVKEAAMIAIQRHTNTKTDVTQSLASLSLSPSSPTSLHLTYPDFLSALTLIRPSSLRSVSLSIPHTTFSSIGGQSSIKQRLIEAIEYPLTHPSLFLRLGLDPPKGVLLYGPPGCSKTLMAKALACESRRNFIAVKGPELFSKWVGESEKAVREVFRKARVAAPSLVFFDEVDAIAGRREGGGDAVSGRVLSQLLSELDGLRGLKGVAVLAATNRPDLIDPALLRPGRIDRVMLVRPPDRGGAVEVLRVHMERMEVGVGVTAEWVMEELERVKGVSVVWSGAELSGLCREAGFAAMEEGGGEVERAEQRHFTRAVERVVPRLDAKMMRFYDEYEKQHTMQSV